MKKKRKSVSKEESSNENLLIISQALNLDFESDDGGNCSVPKKNRRKR